MIGRAWLAAVLLLAGCLADYEIVDGGGVEPTGTSSDAATTAGEEKMGASVSKRHLSLP